MGSNEGSLPPAGWYDDPEGREGRQRYWNGRAWTTRRRPTPAEAGGERFRNLGVMASLWTALGWVVIVLGVLATIAIAASDETTATEVRGGDVITLSADPAVAALVAGLGTAASALIPFTIGAYLRLQISNEANTKRTADLLAERDEP